ncbi:LysE family translocator [Gayadomonas joobiniege]|uniref:LysE family translocator n=1 Tax=Gayadomonas joobiniege TaxID=1234606 RepID=UPI00036E6D3B|nr:LysE family translocator [Gayadomonas joobiniege]
MNLALLSVFISTFFFVSLTPGMCMTLAMSLGMSVGYRRALWMMLGELAGVALVAISAVLGIASIMLNYPWLFVLLKCVGGGYLIYLGICLWQSKSKLAIKLDAQATVPTQSRSALIGQGFVTAVANPKGWAFMVALLPPFINGEQAIAPQLLILVGTILVLEFICMSLYASGGKGLKHMLGNANKLRWVNRISGALMLAVGSWLFIS